MGMEIETKKEMDSSITVESPPEKINGRVEEEQNFKRFSKKNIPGSVKLSPNSNSNPNVEGENNLINNNHVISALEPEEKEIQQSEKIDQESTGVEMNDGDRAGIIQPHSELPKPEVPQGISSSPTRSLQNSFTMGKYLRERSNNFSIAIVKKLNSLKENINSDAWSDQVLTDRTKKLEEVTQFNISGLKVIVKLKNESEEDQDQLKGRISFFSRSNCRDCTAVRTFFRQKGLKFFEINIDVYPQRVKELMQRTGTSQVPQIFFNDKWFGGLVALNSLRNSGTFDQRFREMLGKKCSSDAPAPPVYGFDDDQEEPMDEMCGIIKVLRQRLPIQDRLMKLKIVKNCFSGSEMVEVIIQHLDCGRRKAIGIGKKVSRKHFIHHVFGENEFEDGNHFYRFLEHEPYITKCYNFHGSTNDTEPKPAVEIGQKLNKIMSAILEAYTSDDRCHVNYAAIAKSEEFRRYVNLVHDLHRVNLFALSEDEKLAFFLNLYNAMVIHAIIRVGHPEGVIDRKSFFSDFQYVVGGYPYSLTTIENGILRNNRRGPYFLVKPFGSGDKRLELCCVKMNPLIHFGLCNGTKSSPTVRFFTPEGVQAELRFATREFFHRIEVNLEKRTVYLSKIITWFNVDFGQEKEILKWIINYLDATRAGLLTHLLGDGGPINVVYQTYDWSVNF